MRDLKTYFPQDEGTVKAVDGVSFDLYPGGTLGIVGESGCGKSVTARSILRHRRSPGPDRRGRDPVPPAPAGAGRGDGVVDLAKLPPNGQEMRAIRGAEIALIFQEPMSSFSPVHTVGNQIVEAIMLHQQVNRREARAKTIEMLRRVGVSSPEQRVDQLSNQLSGGLRQRAMIAMALSCHPTLLIADEPTTALDVTTQTQILELMRQLQREDGMAIMLITHDLGVVAEMATDVAVMYLGRVVEQAPVDEIFHAPRHPYTQALLRSIPRMRSRSRERLTAIAGAVPHPYDRPSGCPFHPRCPEFMPGRCDVEAPTPAAGRRQARGELLPLSMSGASLRCFLPASSACFLPEVLLRVTGLQKLFPIRKGFWKRTVGHVRAVDGVDFHIDEGKTLGLVGESGCGKTTTARCILRAIEPTGGEILMRVTGRRGGRGGPAAAGRSCGRCAGRCR